MFRLISFGFSRDASQDLLISALLSSVEAAFLRWAPCPHGGKVATSNSRLTSHQLSYPQDTECLFLQGSSKSPALTGQGWVMCPSQNESLWPKNECPDWWNLVVCPPGPGTPAGTQSVIKGPGAGEEQQKSQQGYAGGA